MGKIAQTGIKYFGILLSMIFIIQRHFAVQLFVKPVKNKNIVSRRETPLSRQRAVTYKRDWVPLVQWCRGSDAKRRQHPLWSDGVGSAATDKTDALQSVSDIIRQVINQLQKKLANLTKLCLGVILARVADFNGWQ